jgi:hypothetical protein
MELSIILAKVMGLALIFMCLAFLRNQKVFDALIVSFKHDLALIIFSGFVLTIMGLLVVVYHNVWTGGWRVLITLLGYLTLLKGLLRLLLPQQVADLAARVTKGWRATCAIVFLCLGIYLTYIGFCLYR